MRVTLSERIAARIGANIRQRRKKELKLTLEKLAELGDYEPGYISAVERAVKRPSLSFLFQIARALDTSAARLLRGADFDPNRAKAHREDRWRLRRQIDGAMTELESLLDEFLQVGDD
ncbi:MAG: helix-turn-helix transcriptional regulator [Acidobacteriota bacterium]